MSQSAYSKANKETLESHHYRFQPLHQGGHNTGHTDAVVGNNLSQEKCKVSQSAYNKENNEALESQHYRSQSIGNDMQHSNSL